MCGPGGIVKIYAPGRDYSTGPNNAVGTIPDSIGQLTALTYLVLAQNVRGIIPPSFGKLQGLTQLFLETPFLGGAIPADLPFAQMTRCSLGSDYGSRFACPLPQGALTGCNMKASACGSLCTGNSAKLAVEQCIAWGVFYDATGGAKWKNCNNSRLDPCSCTSIDGHPVCNDPGTAIVYVGFGSNNMVGMLPSVISAWVDLTWFHVVGNALTGEIPASIGPAWSKIVDFDVWDNHFEGPLPALPFANTGGDCGLLSSGAPGNKFSCPWPPGVTGYCQVVKPDGTVRRITDADCISPCTGASTNLAVDQCLAWIKLYEATGGDAWVQCAGSKTDPCSCGAHGRVSLCTRA